MNTLVFINCGIFILLSALHFYWAFGGKWGIDSAIPEKFKSTYTDEKTRLKSIVATILVALGLMGCCLVMASYHFDFKTVFSESGRVFLSRMIGLAFLARAIGDFNLAGIFKKESGSKFAKADTKIFIPLCLYIGSTSILISFFA